jgi:hypothetical protein
MLPVRQASLFVGMGEGGRQLLFAGSAALLSDPVHLPEQNGMGFSPRLSRDSDSLWMGKLPALVLLAAFLWVPPVSLESAAP